MMTSTPVCWTVWGSRRHSWVVDADPANGLKQETVRDIFGYQIKEDTWVVTTAWPWMEGEMYYEQLSVQQVDYPHGCYAHHEAALHMVNDEYDCELHSVVCVRAVLHFAHSWQRKAKRKLLRRQAAHHVLLL